MIGVFLTVAGMVNTERGYCFANWLSHLGRHISPYILFDINVRPLKFKTWLIHKNYILKKVVTFALG